MAENPQTPLLDRASLEEQFTGYTPPVAPDSLPNIPFRGLNNPMPGGVAGDGESVSALQALDASVRKPTGQMRGGSIMRPLSEMSNPRYDSFVPGDYNNEDAYGQGQGWTSKMVNGVGKGLALTGTTFLQGTVGLVNGVGNWIATGNFSSFYDNPLNRALDDFNKKLDDELLPNYYTDAESTAAWYSPKNLFTANFLWNGIVKNLGFAAGAALSGGVYASGIKALSSLPGIARLVSLGKQAEVIAATEASLLSANKVADTYGKIKSLSDRFLSSYKLLNPAQRAVVAGLATTGEAGFEALQHLNEERTKLIDEYMATNNGLYPTGAAMDEINRKAEQIGDSSFLANVALLTATNYIQFPKILGSSFKAEKGMINSLQSETKEIVQEAGKFIAKPAAGGKILGTLNKIRPYTFSVSEGFEEGAQYAIGVGTKDYFNKKNNNEATSFLDSLSEGFINTFTTDEGMENVLIGGLSGSIMQARGRYREQKERAKNTAEAIEKLNNYKLSDFTRATIDSVNRGTVLQQEREALLKRGDVLNSKDKEADYVINYLSPRIKYGRFDLVQADINDYRALASTDEGFAQLVAEGKALATDTREAFLARVENLQQTANNVKSLYQSINLRYTGAVDEKGNPAYSPAVIDQMVYAASKVADYDVRIPKLSPKLIAAGINVDQVVKDVVEGKVESFNDAVDTIKGMKDLTADQQEDLGQALEDVAEMSIRRDKFLNEYNEMKQSPDKFKEVTREETQGPVPAVKETIKVKVQNREKEIEIGTEYYIGKGVDYDKDGLEVPIEVSMLTVLGENADGTLRIRDNKGAERNISKEKLEDYKLFKASDLRSNKTANYFYRHRNEVFEYNFGSGKRTGRLEYDKGKLFFVYKNDKGKIVRKQVDNSHFAPQEGYTEPRIRKVGEIENAEQKAAREEFTSAEEIKRQEATLAKNKDARLEIITELQRETSERLDQVNKKLENKKKELDSIQKDLDKIGDEVRVSEPRTKREKALEAKYPEMSRQKAKFGRVFSTTSKALTKLSRMREAVQDEIAQLEAEKNELEFNLLYFQDFGQNLDELPENSGEFLKELKDQVKWLEMLVKETGDNINVLAKLSKTIEQAIKDFADLLESSLSKFDADYPQYIKDKLAEIKDGTFTIKNFADLKDYLADYAMLEDLQKEISVNENKLQDAEDQIKKLYQQLDELGNQHNAKKQILDRFQSIADSYQARKAEEDAISNNEQLIKEALGTADTSVQTAEFDKEYEPAAKKADDILPRATIGVNRGKAHQVRANNFGFNLNKFENRDRIRGVYVTSKNEDQIVPGLTDMLRMDEAGVINEDINKDEIIAMVMVEEGDDGKIRVVGEDGVPLPDGANPLDFAVFQVFPDADLKWGAEFNNESMFRKDTPQEVRDSITEQYKAWRKSVLENPSLDERHEIEASFGRIENVTDETGKIDYNTRTSVVDSNLVTADDLEASQVINIPKLPSGDGKLAVESKGTVSFRVPVGTVLLETANGLVKLQNRNLSEKEAETVYNAILQIAKNMLNPEIGIKDPRSERLLSWLRSIVYWGIPKDQSENRKPSAYNSVFFEKDEETGKLMLFISGKGMKFRFTPTSLEENKDIIVNLLSNLYNNINSHKSKLLNEPYEEILSISETGEVEGRMWPNYQTYLLSNTTPDGKKRSGEELPLSTTAKPVEDPNAVNRTAIYFYTTDTADDFVVPVVEKKRTVVPKTLAPKADAPAAAPSGNLQEKTEELQDIDSQIVELVSKRVNDPVVAKAIRESNAGKITLAQLDAIERQWNQDNGLTDLYKKRDALNAEIETLKKSAKQAPAAKPAPKATAVPKTYKLDNKTRNVYVSPEGNKIIFVASPNTNDSNFSTTIKIIKGGDLDAVVAKIKAAGMDPATVLKRRILQEIKPLLPKDEDEFIIPEDEEEAPSVAEEQAEDDESFVILEEDETEEVIPEDEESIILDDVEKTTGKPVSQSILNAINKKIADDEDEPLRAVLKQELESFVPENWNEVEAWLNKNFPNIPVYRVKNIIQATNGKQAWGMFKDGAIYIYENAEVGTAYHEVFHAVWRMFSTPEEQQSVLKEMRARKDKFFDRTSLKDVSYSEATDTQLEEKLAEEFRDYVQFKKIPAKPASGRPFVLKLFADLVTAIKKLFMEPQSDSKVEDMFKKINQGGYKAIIPYQSNLAFANQGVIDIASAFADENTALSLAGINDRERNEIIQHMTYLTLAKMIKTDKSLFEVEKQNKSELYASLKDDVLQTIAKKIRVAEQLVKDGSFTQKEANPVIATTIQLMQSVEDQWDVISARHQEYLKSYQIEFDENDQLTLRDENNSGRGDYQDATKIDNFKKAHSAIKLLLATIPQVDASGKRVPSSIGGSQLLPLSRTYITLMNSLHDASSVEEMLEGLRQIAINDVNYRTLYKRITKRAYNEAGVDISTIDTEHGLQLLSAFWNTFRKQSPDVRNVFILENGEVVVGEANLSTAAQNLRSQFINSIIFKSKSGDGYFTYDEKEKVYKGDPAKLRGVQLDKPEQIVAFLNKMGISFTMKEVKSLTPSQYNKFRSAARGIRESIAKAEKIATFSGKSLGMSGRLLEIALIKAAATNPEFSSTYFNVSGDRTQSYIGTNAASDLYDFLSKLTKFDKNSLGGTSYSYLLTDSFAKNSNLLNRMFTTAGTRKQGSEDLFKIGYVSGTVNETKGKRKESSKLTFKERLIQELNLNLSGWYLNLVPGDASIEWMINMGNPISLESANRGMAELNSIFKGYFLSELELARENRPVAKGRKANEMRFFLGILGDKLHSQIMSDKRSPEEVYKTYEKDINRSLEKFIDEQVTSFKTTLSRYGILNLSETGYTFDSVNIPQDLSESQVNSYLFASTANFMIANIEMHKLLYSDPYQYSDELKRIKNFNSPRQAIINNSPKMNTAFNKVWNKGYERNDIGYTNFTQDYFRTTTLADVDGVIDLPGYEDFKETDGSGIITMNAYRQFRIRASQWNSDEERQYRYDIAFEKKDKGLKLSQEETKLLKAGNPGIKSTYTPLKPIVSGSKLAQDGSASSFNNIILDKFALYPLSYRIMKEINADSNAVKLYNKMQKESIDYVVFASGRKVGARTPHATYNADGSFNDAPYEAVDNIPFSIMSIQAEVPSKEDSYVTRGSQITKLITLDFMEAGVPVDYQEGKSFEERYKAWYALDEAGKLKASELYREIKNNQDLLGALIDEGYRSTLSRLGIAETVERDGSKSYTITDLSKAGQTLRDEILKREVNDNISSALIGFLEGKVVIEATPAYQQVRNIIYSIADKEFISPKMNGGMKVQIPSTFLESNRVAMTEINGKKGYTSDVLKFYEKDGKRVAEVMIGRWFDSDMSDDELLDYLNNTEEGQKILAGVGFRIPTQKQNSIDAIVIKKFLPKEFGDSVVIPAALVAKAGSDFDIDKLSLYLKNVYVKNGKPKLIPYFGKGEEALVKFEELFDKGEFLSDEELKELDRYIAEEQDRLQDIAEESAGGKLLASIFEKLFSEEEITRDFVKEIPAREQIINKLYKKSLENAYIESMENLITHPANYDNLIKPNSAEPLKELAEFIAEKTIGQTFDYKDVKNMLDRSFMSRLRHAFVSGKYAIGIAAVNQTNHSLNQRQPIYIDKDRLANVSDEDRFWLGNADIKFEKYNSIEIDGKMVPTLSMIKNKAGEFISDIIGMFIDGYVDISKGPWIMELGATPNVASTWLFLMKLGVPMKTVTYFMNQPIIRDYLRTIENAGYSWLFIDQFVDSMYDLYDPGLPGEQVKSRTAAFKIPSESVLKNNVGKDSTKMSAQEKLDQYLMLQEFLKYAKMAEHMFHVTQGSNYDTATFNDPFLIYKKQMQQIKAQNTIISSVDDLLANSFVGKLADKISDVRNAFAEILTSDTPRLRGIIQRVLLPYINMSDRDFVKLSQKAVTDLFDWAVQTDQDFNRWIKNIMIKDGGVAREVASFVNEVKKDPNHPLYNNEIVNMIEGVPSPKASGEGVNNIKLNLGENKVYDQNNIIYAFRELRDYLKGENSELYRRIVTLAVIQSGLSSSPISFTSLIPYEDFEVVYNKTLSRLETISNLEDFYNLGVFQRNNWNNDDVVPYMRAPWIKGRDGNMYYNPGMRFLPDAAKNAVASKNVPPLVSISTRNRESNSDYIVYTWEKYIDLLTPEENEAFAAKNYSGVNNFIKKKKAAMKKAGDYSYLNKGLFKKVYDDFGEPLEHEYKDRKYFIYKAANAWGDSFRANEFWDHDQQSVIDNGFVKVTDVDNNMIIDKFLAGKTKADKKGKKDPFTC